MSLYRRVARTQQHEDVAALVEALADSAGIWGSCPDAERESCTQQNYCRQCWVMDITQRLGEAVLLEQRLAGSRR